MKWNIVEDFFAYRERGGYTVIVNIIRVYTSRSHKSHAKPLGFVIIELMQDVDCVVRSISPTRLLALRCSIPETEKRHFLAIFNVCLRRTLIV